MERNLVQVDYEQGYSWRSVSGYRLSDRLILTASPDFTDSGPPPGFDVSVDGQFKVAAVPVWEDRSCGAVLLKIDGPLPAVQADMVQWGKLDDTMRGKVGCEVRYMQPGVDSIHRFEAFLDPRRRDGERNYLLDVRGRPQMTPAPAGQQGSAPRMTGGAVICGREAFCGLVIADDTDHLVILPAGRLLADRHFVQAYEQSAHWPIARGPVRGHAPAAYAAILALCLTVAAFYVNFLQSATQVTVAIIDIFALSLLAWRFLTWLLQARHEVGPRRLPGWRAGAITVAIAAAAALTGLTWAPKDKGSAASAAYCMYDVSAHNPPAVSFPVTPGGYVEQAFIPTAAVIDAISPIIGIDPSHSHTGTAHPMTLELRDASGKDLEPPVSVPDITDNAFTRFNLPEPLHLDLRATYFLRLTNSSAEIVGIYLDPVAVEGDEVNDPDHGAWIVGQTGTVGGYRKPGWALSGCIEAISA